MSWVLEGQRVRGTYHNGFEIEGTVSLSRVCYGGAVQHTVELDEPIMVYGAPRERLLFYSEDIEVVNG
jgi:hypothetical protein